MKDYKNKFYLILLTLFISIHPSLYSNSTSTSRARASSSRSMKENADDCTSKGSISSGVCWAIGIGIVVVAAVGITLKVVTGTTPNTNPKVNRLRKYFKEAKTDNDLDTTKSAASQIDGNLVLEKSFIKSFVKYLSAGEGIPEDKFNSFISDQNKSSIAENINSATKQLNSISAETKLSASDLFDLTDNLPSHATANMADAINTVKDTIVKMKADGTYTSETNITSSDFKYQFAEAAKVIISDATTTGPSNGPTDGPVDGPSAPNDSSSTIKLGNISGARNPILDTSYQDMSLTNTYKRILTRRLGLAKMSKAKVDAKLSELKQSINNLRDQITESDGDTVDIENKLTTTMKETKATEDYAENNDNFESDGDPIPTDG